MAVEYENVEVVEKLKKRVAKLSKILSHFAPQDIEELRSVDRAFDEGCTHVTDVIGSSNPYFRVHPIYPDIKCDINGNVHCDENKYEIREERSSGKPVVHWRCNKRRCVLAAELIMACFDPCPGKRAEYKICYRDGNVKNTKPANLYWERVFTSNG